MKKLLSVLLAVGLALACTACAASNSKGKPEYHSLEAIQKRGVLTVSASKNDNWAAYHVPNDRDKYGERAGTYAGMIPSICEQLASDMGVNLEYTEYSTLEKECDAARSGDVDISASVWAITPERLEQYSMTKSFATVWATAGTVVYLRVNPENSQKTVIENEEQLKTAKIAAVSGSQQAQNTLVQYPQAQIVSVADNAAVLEALIGGKADAAVFTPYDNQFSTFVTAACEEQKIHTSNITVKGEEDLGMGLILMKGNDVLTEYVNGRLDAYIESGQIDEWHNASYADAKAIGIIN